MHSYVQYGLQGQLEESVPRSKDNNFQYYYYYLFFLRMQFRRWNGGTTFKKSMFLLPGRLTNFLVEKNNLKFFVMCLTTREANIH